MAGDEGIEPSHTGSKPVICSNRFIPYCLAPPIGFEPTPLPFHGNALSFKLRRV